MSAEEDDAAQRRQQEAYEDAWRKTLLLTERPPVFNFNQAPRVSVGLMSGHVQETGDASDFSPELMSQFDALQAELLERFPFLKKALTPRGYWHTTIFIPFLFKPFDFLETSTRKVREAAYQEVLQAWKTYGPIAITYRGVTLMPNGDLLIEGHIETAALERLRADLLAKIRPMNPEVKVAGLFSHITFARAAAPSWNDFVRLRDWVSHHRTQAFGRAILRRPLFYAYSDYNGQVVHEIAMAELVPYNQAIQSDEAGIRDQRKTD